MPILQRPDIKGIIVDPRTGIATPGFAGFLARLWDRVGGVSGINAPNDAPYIVKTGSSELLNEFILADLSSGFLKVTNGSGNLTSVSEVSSSELSDTGVVPTTYGQFDQIPVLDIGADGRINAASTTTLVGASTITTVGTITSGTWQAGVIGTSYGGTGVSTLGDISKVDDTNVTLTLGGTPSGAVITSTSLTLGWTGQLGVTRGGTGLSSLTQGDLLYSSSANTLSVLAKNTTATRYLSNTGASNNPAWAQVDLSNGVTGNLSVNNLNSGTSASSSTFWRGDGTWSAPAGAAVVLKCDGRLTLTSGLAVTTSDVTAATTLYFTAYNGNQLTLYDGTTWVLYTFSEISIAIPATTDTLYDVYCYASGGTPTLELLAWTNDTTRATALTTQDGVYVKTGAATRLYLGSVRTTSVSGQTEDSKAKRFLFNMYNPKKRFLRITDTTNSWTYSTASYRQANGSTANQVDFLIGVSENSVVCDAHHQVFNSTGTPRNSAVGIGLDSTTVNSAHIQVSSACTSTQYAVCYAAYRDCIAVGKHYLSWLEKGAGADTQTWVGDEGATYRQSGIIAIIEA
ncbi:MAG TPA: hypothetical protein VGK47_14420 [Nitrososphaeraceae archaeon]